MTSQAKSGCKICSSMYHTQAFCPQKPRKPIKRAETTQYPSFARKPLKTAQKRSKPINKRGKHYKLWQEARAIFVSENPERQCAMCEQFNATDVDHIKKRSTHPHLRYVQSNLQWLCRRCHNKKDNGIDFF